MKLVSVARFKRIYVDSFITHHF